MTVRLPTVRSLLTLAALASSLLVVNHDARGGPFAALRARIAILDLDYDEATKILEGDDDDPAIAIERARLALYRGDCDQAVAHLERPDLGDEDESPHLLSVARGCARSTAATVIESDREHGVVVRFHDDEDRALMPLIVESAVAIRNALERDLGTRLPDPVFIDLVRDQLALSAHTGLPEEAASTTGTVAVAKWGRVMMLSPRAARRGFPWLDTLAHEMTHLVLSQATRDRAPLWLQEGVAKRQETRWRAPDPFDRVPSADAVAAIGIDKGMGLKLTELGPSIAMLPSAEQARVAFAEVSSFVDFWAAEVGADALPKLLATLRNASPGATPSDAIEEVSGLDLAAWDKRWRAHLATVDRTLPAGMAPGDPPPKGAREARRRRRLGVLLEARGHYAEAGTQFRAAFDHAPREPSIRCQLSHNLRLRGESFPAMDLVAHSVDIDYASGRWWSLHGHWHDDDPAASWRRALALDPFNPHVACQEFVFGLPPDDATARAICEAARRIPRE